MQVPPLLHFLSPSFPPSPPHHIFFVCFSSIPFLPLLPSPSIDPSLPPSLSPSLLPLSLSPSLLPSLPPPLSPSLSVPLRLSLPLSFPPSLSPSPSLSVPLFLLPPPPLLLSFPLSSLPVTMRLRLWSVVPSRSCSTIQLASALKDLQLLRVSLSVCLPICVSVCLSLSVCLSIYHSPFDLSARPSNIYSRHQNIVYTTLTYYTHTFCVLFAYYVAY